MTYKGRLNVYKNVSKSNSLMKITLENFLIIILLKFFGRTPKKSFMC